MPVHSNQLWSGLANKCRFPVLQRHLNHHNKVKQELSE
jgi:hypothetical protein